MDLIALATEYLQIQRVVTYAMAAGITLLVYNYLLTFNQEIQYIWRASWNPGKVLFLVVRYLPFVDVPMFFYREMQFGAEPSSCGFTITWFALSMAIGGFVADAISCLRTWAIWDRSRACFALVALSWILTVVLVVYYLVLTQKNTTYSQLPDILPGCAYAVSTGDYERNIYLVEAVFQAVTFLATVIKIFGNLRQSNTRLLSVVYRDAFISTGSLMVTAIVNIVMVVYSPNSAFPVTVLFRVLASIMPARMILNIREAAYSLDGWDVTVGPASGNLIVYSASSTAVQSVRDHTKEEGV